jgi:hypothetical protein
MPMKHMKTCDNVVTNAFHSFKSWSPEGLSFVTVCVCLHLPLSPFIAAICSVVCGCHLLLEVLNPESLI